MTSKEIIQIWFSYICISYNSYDEKNKILKNEYELIKQDLDRLEKLEKVIEILKEDFSLELTIMSYGISKLYIVKYKFNGKTYLRCIDSNKHILLKEVFGND